MRITRPICSMLLSICSVEWILTRVWFEKSGLKAIFKYNLPNDNWHNIVRIRRTRDLSCFASRLNLKSADESWPEADSSFFRLVSLVTYIFAFSLCLDIFLETDVSIFELQMQDINFHPPLSVFFWDKNHQSLIV